MPVDDNAGQLHGLEYNYTSFGNIEADLEAMAEYARRLMSVVTGSYEPDMATTSDAMRVKIPDPAAEFIELTRFITEHNLARDGVHRNVYGFNDHTTLLADAASTLSGEYRGADAFAKATLQDVENAFITASQMRAEKPTGNTETVLEEEV